MDLYVIMIELPSGEKVLVSECEDTLTVFDCRKDAEEVCRDWVLPHAIVEAKFEDENVH